MTQSQSRNRGHSEERKTIALLLPDLVDCAADSEALGQTLRTAPSATRVLVCIPDSPAEPLLSAVAAIDVDTQVLFGHEVEKAGARVTVVRAPPGMSRNDLIEFALALSDVVLISTRHENKRWARHASKNLGKTLVAVGSPLHRLSSEALDVTSGLDPEGRGWHVLGGCIFGRLEQAMLEFLALFGRGGERRKNRIWRSFWPRWWPVSYFAPEGWEESCPDEAAAAKDSHLTGCFEAMDRSALYGSHIHRDITWAAHFGVACAVLFAVLGYVGSHYLRFAVLEFVSLLFAGSVIWARFIKLQERWTACRLGAEQLRIARMSLPLLVLPRALATADAENIGDDAVDYELSALVQVKRAVRQQGLPHVDYSSVPAVEAARWLKLVVNDQIRYHERNLQTLERAEVTLNAISTMIFLASLITVALPLFVPSLRHSATESPFLSRDSYLVLSAAGPAFVAALHGAGMRLGFVHRAALSHDMKKQLADIAQSLDALVKSGASSTSAWHEVRALAYAAAEAMGAENSSWHRLVRRYRDELP
jgi:hypothetical protein